MIQTQFNKASQSYDDVATIQKKAAYYLVNELLKYYPIIPKTVLDIGTGTGYVPELLLPKYTSCAFYLNDNAQNMLDVCQVKF
jgi:malonyl-CoA O-methyltransferase